jgi:dUTP pyrophosphatase
MYIEIKFKKIHPDAQLPARKHGNRGVNEYEQQMLDQENKRFAQERPDLYAAGGRVGYPVAMGPNGERSDLILGTGDTGYDIFAVEDKVIPANSSAVVDTGIEVAYVTPGYWFAIMPRSGLGFKYGLQPHLGTIDNPFRGGLGVKLYNFSDILYEVKKGDRIAQIIFYPIIEPVISWSDEKIETARGENGFGSSGK